ncbi:MAG: DNA-binding protein [Verrucomicrobiales bacterium]|nr:DNA-binding protein [Verrucomicrobiales bacterium]
MTLVDSNVLLDVIQDDVRWAEWSSAQLAAAFDRGPVVINPIIFAEVALAFDNQAQLESYFRPSEYQRRELPWKAAMLAAKAFIRYRQRGGAKTSPLPDFYIGAQAQAENLTLLTRDIQRYRAYFPEVRLISPN